MVGRCASIAAAMPVTTPRPTASANPSLEMDPPADERRDEDGADRLKEQWQRQNREIGVALACADRRSQRRARPGDLPALEPNALRLARAARCIDDLAEALPENVIDARRRPGVTRPPSIRRGVTPDCEHARPSFAGGEDQIDGGVAGDMRKLRCAEECRQRHDDLSRHRARELSDGPINSVRREDSHHAGARIDFAREAGYPSEKLATGKRAIRIAHRNGGAVLARMALHGVKQRSHGALLGALRKCPAASGGLVIAKTRGCSA